MLTSAGDDCIAIKGNSSNVYVKNITCSGLGSSGMPIGSIGQVPGQPDYVHNITFEDVLLYDNVNSGWIKTWQGKHSDVTGNGDTGGGGGGAVKNVTFRNFRCEPCNQPIYVTQCIYGGDASVCDTSQVRLTPVLPSLVNS